jgi:hypothetical protein
MGRGSGRAGRERDQDRCQKARHPTTGGRVVGSWRQRAQCRSRRTSPSTKSQSPGCIGIGRPAELRANRSRCRRWRLPTKTRKSRRGANARSYGRHPRWRIPMWRRGAWQRPRADTRHCSRSHLRGRCGPDRPLQFQRQPRGRLTKIRRLRQWHHARCYRRRWGRYGRSQPAVHHHKSGRVGTPSSFLDDEPSVEALDAVSKYPQTAACLQRRQWGFDGRG